MEYYKDYKEYLQAYIESLEVANKELQSLSTTKGFMKAYADKFIQYSDAIVAFTVVNEQYKSLVGNYRFNCYEDFKNTIPSYAKASNVEILERNFLLAYFKSKGFTTFEIFRPMVLVYYPEINVAKLKLFFENKTIDTEVLKYVGNVYQIIKPL